MKAKAKSSPPKRKRHVLFISVTEPEHRQIAELAEQNSRTISEEVLTRLKSTLDNATHKEALIREGWVERYDPRYGGNVLLPPGTVIEALNKITGTLVASEAPDSASVKARAVPKNARKEWRRRAVYAA